jgi:hypothetical protein
MPGRNRETGAVMHQWNKTSAQSSIKQISDSKNSKKDQLAYLHVIVSLSVLQKIQVDAIPCLMAPYRL